MKNKFILLFCMVLVSMTFVSSAFSGFGSGTPEDPYQITTCSQLQEMRDYLSNDFALMNDINCNEFSFTKIDGFSGSLNGNAYTISNLVVSGWTYVGLFGILSGGTIHDLGLISPVVTGDTGVSALVGWLDNSGGTINNVYVDNGSVSCAATCGMIVGYNCCGHSGEINNVWATGEIIFTGNLEMIGAVGGLVGYMGYSDGANLLNSYSIVSSTTSQVGGLVGSNYQGSCVGSFWDTEVSGLSSSACGTGKTTSQMKTLSTFTDAGWNFDTIWYIENSYPLLQVFQEEESIIQQILGVGNTLEKDTLVQEQTITGAVTQEPVVKLSVWQMITGWFQKILNWFKGLFN